MSAWSEAHQINVGRVWNFYTILVALELAEYDCAFLGGNPWMIEATNPDGVFRRR